MAKNVKQISDVFLFNMEDFEQGDLEDLIRLGAMASRNEKRMFKATIGDEFVLFVAADTVNEVAKTAQDEFPHPFQTRWFKKDFKEVTRV